jgi:O-antigen/teichoic acid export membrane protein
VNLPSGAILWATASSWVQQGFGLLTLLVLARLGEPEMFGTLATALLFVIVPQRILIEGFAYYIVQTKLIDDYILSTVAYIATSIGLVFALIFLFLAGPMSALLSIPDLQIALAMLATIPLLDGISIVHVGLLRREGSFKQLAQRTAIAGLLSCVAAIGLGMLGFGLLALLVQQLMQSLGNCLCAIFSHTWRPRLVFKSEAARGLFRFAGPMSGNALLHVAINRLDIALLSSFSDPSSTGVYSVAKRLVRSIMDLLVSGIAAVGLTRMAAAKEDLVSLGATLVANLRLATWLALPSLTLLGIVGPRLLPHLIAPEWSSIGSTLAVLCAAGVLQVVLLIGASMFTAIGASRSLVMQSCCALLVFVVAAYILGPVSSVSVGLAFLAQAFSSFLMFFVQLAYRGIGWRAPVRALWPIFFACCAGVLASQVAWWMIGSRLSTLPLVANLSLGSALFVTTYLVVSLALCPDLLHQLRRIARRKSS